jgi:ketosteroid isomerase-like protein
MISALLAAPVTAQEPGEVVIAFHEALARGDTSGTLSYLDPDVLIFESGGAETSRDEFASSHMGADMAYAAATTRETIDSRTEVAGHVAIVMSRTKTTGSYREREVSSTGTETVVLRRAEGQWRIVHIHWSSRRQR